MKLFLLLPFVLLGVSTPKLTPIKSLSIKVKEPSGICYQDGFHYVVSDNGKLYKTNKEFQVVQKASFKGIDFEGVCATKQFVFVSDETARKIYVFNTNDLSLATTHSYTYSGGRNKGVEAITINTATNTLVTITEKEPSLVQFYTLDFTKKNETTLHNIKDVSDITYHQNHYYVLSDEERKIIKYDVDFTPLKEWKINIINPEGIAFNEQELIITSDDMQKVYVFDAKTLIQHD